MTYPSRAGSLFNAEEMEFPKIYMYLDLEGKKQLREIKVSGTSIDVGKPYNIREHQSLEMALNALNPKFSHYHNKNKDVKFKPAINEQTIESLLFEISSIENYKDNVYILTLQKEMPLHDTDKLYAFLAQLKRLSLPLEKGVKITVYKAKEAIEAVPSDKRSYVFDVFER